MTRPHFDFAKQEERKDARQDYPSSYHRCPGPTGDIADWKD